MNRSTRRTHTSRPWRLIILGVVAVIGGYLAASRTRLLPAYWRVPAPLPAAAETRDERLRQDLTYLATELPRLHVDAFHSLSEDAFAQAVADLDAAIPTLADREVMLRMVQLVAMLGDGHTRAYPIDDTEFTLSPLQLYWFEDGISVIATTPAYDEALNTRVIAVQGVPIEEVTTALAPLVAHENDAGLKGRLMLYVTSPGLLSALGLAPESDTATWLLARADGTQFTLEVDPISPDDYTATFSDPANAPTTGELPLYRRHADEAYGFEVLPETHTLYFAYNRCREMTSRPFKAFSDEIFEAIDTHDVEHLVVDLRNNGGGNSRLLAPFIDRLEAHPLNREGALTVIVGRGTFSSAVLNALELARRTEATFVGEATSGSPAHYGEMQSFVLPNSHMQVTYATKYFPTRLAGATNFNTGDMLGAFGYSVAAFPVSDPGTPTFEPDVRIAPTSADYAAGRDPVMAWVLAQGAE